MNPDIDWLIAHQVPKISAMARRELEVVLRAIETAGPPDDARIRENVRGLAQALDTVAHVAKGYDVAPRVPRGEQPTFWRGSEYQARQAFMGGNTRATRTNRLDKGV